MALWTNKWSFPVAAALLVLAGCREEAPRATLEPVAAVQGTSFNEPGAPVEQEAAAKPEETPVAALADAGTSGLLDLATADDIPFDIAQIPTATPVTRYEVAPTPEPPATAESKGASAPVETGDYKPISFQVLSGFTYQEPIPAVGEKPQDVEKRRESNQIPEDVVALNGSKAVVEGWMVPMEVLDDGSVKSFVLVKTQPQCCFGDTQSMNEWVDVNMGTGKKAEFNVDTPVRVFGEFEVGEKVEDGFVLSIYRMKADRVGS